MPNLKELRRKRASYKAKLTQFEKYLLVLCTCQSPSSVQLSELGARLQKIEECYGEYDSIQSHIESLPDISDAECQDEYSEREFFESQYFTAVGKARELLSRPVSAEADAESSVTGSVLTAGGPSLNLKLPTIHLPTFSGQYENWLEFHDTYVSLIHNNGKIPKISKFHYLRSALKDKAANVITSLDFSENNYDTAWSLLCERYQNNNLFINNHIEALFEFDNISKESPSALRNLIDTVNKNLRSLKMLQVNIENWDLIIIHIMCKKLDSVTSRTWKEHLNFEKCKLPTLERFLDFIKQRAELLETVDHTNKFTRRHSEPVISKPKAFVTNQKHKKQTISYTCFQCNQNHAIYLCPQFMSLSVKARIAQAKKLNLCKNCLTQGHEPQDCKFGPCRVCSKKHNTALHMDEPVFSKQSDIKLSQDKCVVLASQEDCHSDVDSIPKADIVLSASHDSCVLLSTALIDIIDCNGKKHTVRALLDNGSTSNFMTEKLCHRLNLPVKSTSTSVEGLSHSLHVTKRSSLTISSRTESYINLIDCFIVPRITQLLPSTRFDISHLNIPNNIKLADPSFNIPLEIDILLNAEIFWNILGTKRISLGKNKPVLIDTKMGWLVSGVMHSPDTRGNKPTVYSNIAHCNVITDGQLQQQLDRFFELESVSSTRNITKEENECEQNFIKTTTRMENGRFVVKIPLKQSPETLGDSYEQALSRFQSLERKFKRDLLYKENYSKFIKEYIDLGHMSLANHDTDTWSYFMPHHGVIRDTSLTTKLRVVFDASAKSTSQLSFNDIQYVGPTVQDPLIDILIRFRQHKYVVTSDCEKMYRCVEVAPEQRCLQKILWRFDASHKIDTYKLNTVTYGTAAAPYIATRCLVQLGQECSSPLVRETILHDFYVDDFISGHNSEAELLNICQGVIEELKKGQFHLRKWRSNNINILNSINEGDMEDQLLKLVNDDHAKILGLRWSCTSDTFSFATVSDPLVGKISKRSVLSTVGQVFDPLGFVNPCILQAKIILQELWASKIGWDDPLPPAITEKWLKFLKSLLLVNNIIIPRLIICDQAVRYELHTFSDASLQAYSACVYIRSVSEDGNIMVHLVMAKSKVAPLKAMTVPRLELSGALMAVRLAIKVKNALRLNIDSCTFWCDSTIVLGWIRTPKSSLKAFVCNRINEITDATDAKDWNYISTKLNPADIGSRGCTATQLEDSKLWWTGPPFLTQPKAQWPTQTHTIPINLPETKVVCNLVSEENKFIYKFSNFSKLQRVTAYILRFINNCRHPHNKSTAFLTISELNSATLFLCKLIQQDKFSDEYSTLKKGQSLKRSQLLNLNPFMSQENVIRVGGRLSNSNYTYDVKHPILIHASHHITEILFRHYHTALMHAGPQLLLATVRQRFWVIGGRNLARSVTHECHKCCRFAGRTIQPIMADLPKERVHSEHPFSNTAVDYAGPILIVNKGGRGSQTVKSYICIFVCLAVRAVHVELVTDLSTEAFLAALNRFVARRGRPVNIYSDNGTNFVGAYSELSTFMKSKCNDISSYAAEQAINFKFSPAYSPHFNGLAEGAVKSVKLLLKRILSLAHLTYEELNTVLIQIEGILNSRPLTPLSSDPNDLTPLTPSHFLIGRTVTMLPTRVDTVRETRINSLPRYKRVQALATHFWNRYQKEYLAELQKRAKWQRHEQELLRLGDLVVIKDDRLPPNHWRLGRIVKLHPGTDGIARVADVKTSSGEVRRAYNRLCLLPTSSNLGTSSNGGSLLARTSATTAHARDSTREERIVVPLTHTRYNASLCAVSFNPRAPAPTLPIGPVGSLSC